MGTKAKFYVATSSGWVEANFGSTGSGSFYGVSSESSTTRTATLTNDNGNFELVVGATVNIKFTHASSSDSMTLNVNNTGKKPIKQNSSNTTEWKAGAIINLVYDGSNWIVSGVGSTVDTDKKTASTPSNEKLYLIGSTAQGTDGQATYSNSNVYTKNGVIYVNGVNTSSISSNSSIAFYAGGGGESSIEYSNISGTGVISNGHFISYGDDDNSNENKPANKTDFTDLDSYYFNTGITLYDSDSSRKYKLSFPAKSGTFATLDDTKIEAGTGLQLSGTTFSANLNSTTSLGTIGSTSKLYPVGVDANGKLAVSVPWVDTNTDTHYTNYFQIKGNGTEAIKFTQNADKSLNFKPGNNVSISAATNEITISANVPTKVSDLTDSSDYALKSDITSLFKFQGSLTSINNLPTSPEPGDVYNISNAFTANSSFPNDNGKSFPAGTNVVYVFGEFNNYWEVLGGTYSNATTTTSGLMSSNDKSKLDGIADNANNYSHPSTHPASMITGLAKVATSGQYSDLSGALTLSGNGSATTAARSDHNHNGVYSPIGHTHNDYITSAYLGQNYYTKSEIDDDFATANHTHNFQYLTNRGEAYLDWGGRNIVAGITPIDAAISNVHSANRFAFANPAGITIEKSTDGGNTWVDYGTTDNAKVSLVSGIGTHLRIGGKTSGITINDKLRITLNATNMYIYTRLLKLLLNISTQGAIGSNVKVERAMKGSETTFSTIGTYDIEGWSGWNSIPIGYGFGGDSTQTYNAAILRLTFGITGLHSTYASVLTVHDIVAIGDTYWTYPSVMAKTGHLYDYDSNKNATFPANVSATSFVENGTSLSNKYAPKSHTHNYAGSDSVGGAATSANKLNNIYSWRPTSANLDVTGDGSIKTFKATSSMTAGKPMNDGHIIHSEWDNDGGYSTQLYIPHDQKDSMQYRGMMGGVWWDSWRTLIDSANIGSQSVNYATTAGKLVVPENAFNINFRPNLAPYTTGFYYGTNGNEALTLTTKNTVTAIQFMNGQDPATLVDDSWRGLTPALQIKYNKVAINKALGENAEPGYNLDVNGSMGATTIYEGGTSLTEKYAAKSHTHSPDSITGAPWDTAEGTPFVLGCTGSGAAGAWLDLNSYYSLKTHTHTSAPALDIRTTEPTSANTSGTLKVVVLSSEPSTKYNGWLYIITG